MVTSIYWAAAIHYWSYDPEAAFSRMEMAYVEALWHMSGAPRWSRGPFMTGCQLSIH